MSKTEQSTPFTKEEALEILSAQLRKPDLEPNVAAKLMLTYGRIAGWGIRPRQKDVVDSEPDTMDKLVTEIEKKRKAEKKATQEKN
jgi:hypothetical protein